MAIMGPSGSGKTSLLNLLSFRQNLSRNAEFSGTIEANRRVVGKEDYGKFGSYV